MINNILNKKIGIIGGGQLGKMMIMEAKKFNFYIVVLDPNPKCPCSAIANEHIIADFDDEEAIFLLMKKTDVMTYEFEHINAEALLKLEKEGKEIYPTATSLKIIQNKFNQKQLLKENNIPIPEFIKINSQDDIRKSGEVFGYPFLLKTCTGGYDGKGNFIIKNETQLELAYSTVGNGKFPLMAEKYIDFSMEISVLACRGINGEIQIYPVAHNIHNDNILIETLVPASLSKEITENAMATAKKVMEIFKGVGMFCVEMFVSRDNKIFVNEVAPRPHNSGHYTIEGNVTSQFEQHIRAITGLPLGDPTLVRPTVMRNILGQDDYFGNAIVVGLEEALKINGVKVHIYGKEVTSPKRKMGHLTVSAATIEEASALAENAINKICIKSECSKENTMENIKIGIIMGSDSDLPVMSEAAKILDSFGISYELTIVSAHRTPENMFEYAKSAYERGLKVIIAGAGGAAHLPGMISALTSIPVIGVPIKTSTLNGLDSLYSIVQMPGGVPVATVAINGSLNAGILAAQILGTFDKKIYDKVCQYKDDLKLTVSGKANSLENLGYKVYAEEKLCK